MKHLNTDSILIDQQFGFRSRHSCEYQLISVIEDIHLAMDHSHQVEVIFHKVLTNFLTNNYSLSYITMEFKVKFMNG